MIIQSALCSVSSFLLFPVAIGRYARFANPVLHSELKTHTLHMKLQWMVSTAHFQH
jgi:hypothetical protein